MSFNCALVGKDVSKSLSPLIHKYFGEYSYSLLSVDENELVKIFTEKNFDGLNVTIPYKKTVMPYLDEISPEAEKIGSVNTVVNRNGCLSGYNTDYFGFQKTLEKIGVSPKNKKALVLGSGGASLAVKAVLKDGGASEVITISRSGDNNYLNISKHFDAQIIVNTTPVGKYPNITEKPLSLDGFNNLSAVIDINYNPVKSALLIEAEEKGVKFSGGLTMLVWQAKKSAEFFTGKTVESVCAEKAEKEILRKMRNIVFIGMPSSGKSAVGKIVAEKTDRAFVDTDDMIENALKTPPAEIIVSKGESFFRSAEKEQVQSAAKSTNTVVATGGGAVLDKDNVRLLRQNGILVFLDRPLEELSAEGRPLSKNLSELFEKRLPIYRNACDIEIKTESTASKTAEKVLEALKEY